jgi:hypothetical protein
MPNVVFTVVMESLYPPQLCLAAEPVDANWLGYLLGDGLVLHSALFSSQAMLSAQFGFHEARNSRTAMHHQVKSLHLLQPRLNPTDVLGHLCESTIMAIIALSLTSQFLNDQGSSEAHMNGLYHLVRLRGGLNVLLDSAPDLVEKICRWVRRLCQSIHTWMRD